jgi:hypothetical protein
LTYAHDSLRLAGIALAPVMPSKMPDLLDRLGVEDGEWSWDRLKRVGDVEGVGACVERMMVGAKKGKREVLFPALVEAVVTEV